MADLTSSDSRPQPVPLAPLPKRGRYSVSLPASPAPLVGRERALGEAAAVLVHRDIRLLTLTGRGGVAKTRFALEIAADLAPDFPDGVVFVDLAPIRDPTLVVPTIAQALGVREMPGSSLQETLSEVLRKREPLLVLDNLEQVIKAGLDVAMLVGGAPRLRVLGTSRAPLRVRAEREYPVEPMPLPDPPLPASALGGPKHVHGRRSPRGGGQQIEALTLWGKLGDRRGRALAFEGLALVARARDLLHTAARLARAAAGEREVIRFPLPPRERIWYEPVVAELKAALGSPAFAAAWEAGRALPVDAAVTEALALADKMPAVTADA